MDAPGWIRKRVSRDEFIECFAEGRIEGFDNETNEYERYNSAAVIGTNTGIYFVSRASFAKGFSHFNTWESFLKKAYVYSETGLFRSKIIINIKKTQFVLTAKKSAVNQFISYYANKKKSITDHENVTPFVTPANITESLKSLKSLYDEGIISEEEYETKRIKLLNKL